MTGKSGGALLLAAVLAGLVSGPARAQEEVENPSEEMAPPPPPVEDDTQPQQQQQGQQPAAFGPPAQEPTQQQFDETLSQYGRWVDTADYGRVWVPGNVGADWQPYTDGQWVDTSYGWSFAASVPWGWATYHYGRWGFRNGGWFWVPGYHWAPAWVAWRHVNGYAAWSPLAPRGFAYGHSWPGWVVVPHAHFTAPIRRWAVPSNRVGVIVRSARPVQGFGSQRFVRPVMRGPVVVPGRRVETKRH
ncbi:MAG TPA: DUF6600 domain-containing protein [Myxococcales bacterium]|nr:DUF6600 domain-containing protein [Myxococcales bacterium]